MLTNFIIFKLIYAKQKNKIVNHINTFINDPQGTLQSGVVFFLKDDTDGHPVSSILCRDKINKNVVMLIADGMQGFKGLERAIDTIHELKIAFPNLEIRFDLTGRQVDANSCSTEAILYLIAALQCDMLTESTLLSTTLEDARKAGYPKYYLPIDFMIAGENSLTPALQNCKLFISPIQTFYHSQLSNIAEVLYISPSIEANNYIEIMLKDPNIMKYHEECLLVQFGRGHKIEAALNFTCNSIVWKIGLEFKCIIDYIISNQEKTINTIPENINKDIIDETQCEAQQKYQLLTLGLFSNNRDILHTKLGKHSNIFLGCQARGPQ